MFNTVKEMAKENPDVYSVRLYVERTNLIARKTYTNVGIPLSHYDMA